MFARRSKPASTEGAPEGGVIEPPPQDCGGSLDWAAANLVDATALVSGWVSVGTGDAAWLEAGGQRHPLEAAFRFPRGDLMDSERVVLGRARGACAAFAVALPGVPAGHPVRLRMQRAGGAVHTLFEREVEALPLDPVAALRLLCQKVPSGRWRERFEQVDAQVLQPLIDHQARWARDLPSELSHVGPRVAQPRVSIVIPLYGRFDFVEPQLMRFRQDPWLLAHAELIYVVDDLTLVDRMRQEAEGLHALYGVPFRWVWGQVNRGFSGANNLGVSVAQGEHLIFLNSDVFPVDPGWAQALSEALEAHPTLGAIAPRLLHADGTVQHAGMRFEHLPALGIWSNQHPGKGLPEDLVPGQGLEFVPAVTGACLAVRRHDLAQVGGWDTGYLIGDFEDSDLCLSLAAQGLGSACLHSVRMVHLERQSFRRVGDETFRGQVVLLNAVRHQRRWGPALERLAGDSGTGPQGGVDA